MTTKQAALIREASKKEVGAHRWRIRMEKWLAMQPIDLGIKPDYYWGDFGCVSVVRDPFLKPAR